MGLAHSPKIVTNGMVLCLDAANVKSYPGTGTTWTDLSVLKNNGTITGSPAYNTTNKGSFVFTGTEYVTFTSPTLTNQITYEVWVKLNATVSADGWIGGIEGAYRILYSTTGFSWICATVNNAWYTAGTFVSASVAATAGIYHVVGTYDGANLKIYINGILQSTGSAISGNIATNANVYNLFRDDSGSASVDSGLGSLYTHRAYNRALTAAEVQQNFNALRGRFGI